MAVKLQALNAKFQEQVRALNAECERVETMTREAMGEIDHAIDKSLYEAICQQYNEELSEIARVHNRAVARCLGMRLFPDVPREYENEMREKRISEQILESMEYAKSR
jgi:hypothetical protein